MRLRLLFNLVACLLLMIGSACATDPLQLENEPTPSTAAATVRPDIGEVFQLAPGELASVGDGELLVAFHSVRQDSRCPSDATCVWQGDAESYIGTARGGSPWSWTILHTGLEPMSRNVGGLVVAVVGLDPAPTSGVAIPPGSYRISLRVTRP